MTTTFKQNALYAYDARIERWAPVLAETLHNTPTHPFPQPLTRPGQQELTLASWNIDAFGSLAETRAAHVLGCLLERPKTPDIIFLQEVKSHVYDSLLRDGRVRAGFLATDAEDRTAFHGVPFATAILLSRVRFFSRDGPKENSKFLLGLTGRVQLPSKYRRDGLFVDVHYGMDEAIRLINVHLDSLPHAFDNRAKQIRILTRYLRENGYKRGLIAGDFNAISAGDHKLVSENGLRDQWIALHGEESSGYTWGIDRPETDEMPPGRLDKVATIGLEATAMEVIHPGKIAVPRAAEVDEEIPWSDHSGLMCSFKV